MSAGGFVLAAGGTGGHLFPARALAAELIRHGREVRLLTDARTDAFSDSLPGLAVDRLKLRQPYGGPAGIASGLTDLATGAFVARRLLRNLRPAAVIGFGGYPSLPTMLAAATLRLPTLIHEQNAVLGRANRLLAPYMRRIATGFPDVVGLRAADRARAVHTGNPVRAEFLALGEAPYHPPDPAGAVELLVLGGSQGAHILAEIVPAALAQLPLRLRLRLRVAQQARPEDCAAVVAAFLAAGIAAEVERFFTDVPVRLARAHLVVCRAGASTIAELAALGRPAVLIPYPFATDDHQTANARAFAAAGGGEMVAQSALHSATLAEKLMQLIDDGAALRRMAGRAAAFGRPDATRRLAQLAVALLPGAAAAGLAA